MFSLMAKVEKRADLTPREARVLQQLCEGKTDQAIATALAMSIKTVECHCGHIYDKLQIRSASVNVRCAAIATAVARGLVVMSTRVLCVLLLVGAVQMDDAARVGRGSVRPVSVVRVRRER